MEVVRFFEKPGCINNTKQKKLLIAAGYELEVHDLLGTSWTMDSLKPYFEGRAITDCFNRTAPRVKSGEVSPEDLSWDEALKLMIEDPILIRRPLIQTDQGHAQGFDTEVALPAIGIDLERPQGDVETCPRTLKEA
ncbi:MAG: ArsC/Spx/MgsR family protein [Magnetovibrionaceae bacterium]